MRWNPLYCAWCTSIRRHPRPMAEPRNAPELTSEPVALAAVVARLAAVAAVQPLRDDLDVRLGAHGVATLEQRFVHAADRLALDGLERAVLAAVALRELSPQLAAALGRLAPAGPGGAATPRAVARLLAGADVSLADVLFALGPDERLRRHGAVRLSPAPDGSALADRSVVLADRLTAVLLGAAIDDPARDGRLRRVAPASLPSGHADVVERIAALIGQDDGPPVAVHGPDAALAVSGAAGRGLVCVACAELADPYLARDAVLAAALEERVLVVDRLAGLEATDRELLPDRLAQARGAVLCLAGQDELAALEHVPATAVAVPRVRADVGWDDLVLPERALTLLRSLAAFLRHRDRVPDAGGFARHGDRDPGLVAMFAGERGTGKTLAARVLAADLGVELLRGDLAAVVSTSPGEAQDRVDRVFAAARRAGAVLFLDEADAVFGRRSAVEDAHDRTPKLQTAYLLQAIEQHDGAVLLATSMRADIDDAFLRRMDAVVEFPFPAAEHRLRLWELLLAPQAPRRDDVALELLAERFELPGGGIRNAALAAAALAARDGVAIGMEQLVQGVAMEYARLGRPMPADDSERPHGLLRGADGAST
jgi:hypothetical protein